MGTRQFSGDCQTKASAAGSRRCLKGFKQMLAHSRWNAGTIIRNGDMGFSVAATCSNAHLILRQLSCLNGLQPIAHQISQNTRQLFTIRVNFKWPRNLIEKRRGVARLRRQQVKNLIHDIANQENFAARRQFLGATIGQSLIEKANGPVQ